MHNAGLATSEDTAFPHSPRLQHARMHTRQGSSCSSQPGAEASLAGLPEDPPSPLRSQKQGTLQPVCTSFSRKGAPKSASSERAPYEHQTDGRSSSPCPSGTGADVLESSFHFRPPSQPSSPAAADDGSSGPKHSPAPHQSSLHGSSRGSPSHRSPTRHSPSPHDYSRQRHRPPAEPAQQELDPADGSDASPHLHGPTRHQHGNIPDSHPVPADREDGSAVSRPSSRASSRGEQEADGPMHDQPSSHRPDHNQDSAEESGSRSDPGSADGDEQGCHQQQQQQRRRRRGSCHQADKADEACSHSVGSPQGLAQLPGRAWAGRKRRRIRVHGTLVHRPSRRRPAQGESMHAGAMHEGGQAYGSAYATALACSCTHAPATCKTAAAPASLQGQRLRALRMG